VRPARYKIWYVHSDTTCGRAPGQFREFRERWEPALWATLGAELGERSSHTWFVLTELLGYPDVRNYDSSWTDTAVWWAPRSTTQRCSENRSPRRSPVDVA
jgi:hypothetical protein